MTFESDLRAEVKATFLEPWTQRDGTKVPEPENLKLGNDGVDLDAAVLYADMAGSTNLVDRYKPAFAAEVYKAYLMSAARIIKKEGGTITAYDGDRIMAVFVGDTKRTIAARTALKINYALSKIVNPELKLAYPKSDFVLKHVVGVDCSKLLAARIGIRNDNDLVWVGRAANYAAKLTELNDRHPVFITAAVYDAMHENSKMGGVPRQAMWEKRQWTQMNNATVYSSNWTWTP